MVAAKEIMELLILESKELSIKEIINGIISGGILEIAFALFVLVFMLWLFSYIVYETIRECKERDLSKESFFEKIEIFIKECIPWSETRAFLLVVIVLPSVAFINSLESPKIFNIYNKFELIEYTAFFKEDFRPFMEIKGESYKENMIYLYEDQLKAPLERICDQIVGNISNLDKDVRFVYVIRSESKKYERYNNTYCILY